MLKKPSQKSDGQAGTRSNYPCISPGEGLSHCPPLPIPSCTPGTGPDVKALGSIPTGRTDSTAITSDATEYTLRQLQPATKYEIGVKSVRGREESEVASITVHTGGKELLVGSSNQTVPGPAPGRPCLH